MSRQKPTVPDSHVAPRTQEIAQRVDGIAQVALQRLQVDEHYQRLVTEQMARLRLLTPTLPVPSKARDPPPPTTVLSALEHRHGEVLRRLRLDDAGIDLASTAGHATGRANEPPLGSGDVEVEVRITELRRQKAQLARAISQSLAS